ncbi:hypothetical protein C8A05DRAFT_37623, partial [Staphylotrichum tortipilum]
MSPTPLQILSDLHLETHPSSTTFIYKQTAPHLALLGDIAPAASPALYTFLEAQLRRYWTVFFVPGNHEPWGASWPAARQRLRAFAERMEVLRAKSTIGRFVLLDRGRWEMPGGLVVLGCTLFSRVLEGEMGVVGSRMGDFQPGRIGGGWDVEEHVRVLEPAVKMGM